MMIYVDTREKKWDNIKRYFDENSIPYDLRKLSCGDYMRDDRPDLSIDRKRNLEEISGNLFSASVDKEGHKYNRFWHEVRRSREIGVHLVVLIEHGGQIHCLDDVRNWHSKYSKVSGSRLRAEMIRVSLAYDVEFQFCAKVSTGRRIMEILYANDS